MGEQGRTFERDDDNLFATVPAPLFDVVKGMYQDACIDDDEICVLVCHAVGRPAGFLLMTELLFRVVSLPICVVFLGVFLTGWLARLGTMDDAGTATVRIVVGDAHVGLLVTTISPVSSGAVRDGLFKLFDLMAEESGTESAGHGELIGRGCRGRSLGTG